MPKTRVVPKTGSYPKNAILQKTPYIPKTVSFPDGRFIYSYTEKYKVSKFNEPHPHHHPHLLYLSILSGGANRVFKTGLKQVPPKKA
jgi:hypothetical protein